MAETYLDKRQEAFEAAYAQYWSYVKDHIDLNGWCRSSTAPHIIDYYYEAQTGNEIEWSSTLTYKAWRPKSLNGLEQL